MNSQAQPASDDTELTVCRDELARLRAAAKS
jgi:hypothetical protein